MTKKNILIIALFIGYAVQSQVGVGIPNPGGSAVLELNSREAGFLPPRLTTVERDAIATPSLGLIIFNTTKNCLEWYVGTAWFNGCGDNGVAVADSYICNTGSAGGMTAGVPVSGVSQTITVTVLVAGGYNITAVSNGVTFSARGNFTSVGSHEVVLNAVGTPLAAGNHDFILNTSPNTCTFSRTVSVGTGAASSFVCNIASTGEINTGIPVMGVTQTIRAMVTTIGSYNITALANGVTFAATGSYLGTGPQDIVLRATGTPIATGDFNFVLSGTPTCVFSRSSVVGPSIISNFACGAGTGVLNMGVPVTGVTQSVTATVSRIGTYTISASVNGVTFSGSGTFTTVGANNVVLTATGTPLAAGSHDFVINGTPTCTFNRQTIVGIGVISSIDCNTASTGGLNANTPIGAGVTQTVTAMVGAVGSYTLRAVNNGVTFSATGTFTATGAQTVVLVASGTPVAGGTVNFALEGTPSCTFSREVTTMIPPVVGLAGRTWMAINLGATAIPTSSTDASGYGDLYQWGRKTDGHEKRNSGTTTTRSDEPTDGLFIVVASGSSEDWRVNQDDTLWSDVNGPNNPCPASYRVATQNEWMSETSNLAYSTIAKAFAAPLKLPLAGARNSRNGGLVGNGRVGVYWTSTPILSGTILASRFFDIGTVNSNRFATETRAIAGSVRCILNE